MLGRTSGASIQFGQSVDKVMIRRSDTIIHRKIDDFQLFREVVALYKFLCIAMSGAKEKYINVIQWKFVCKSQIALSVKSFVYVGYFISGITTTITASG